MLLYKIHKMKGCPLHQGHQGTCSVAEFNFLGDQDDPQGN
jgi:hypothetical protein